MSPVEMEPRPGFASHKSQSLGGSLTDTQKLHLRASCQCIDKLLSSAEDILLASQSKSPFPKYKVDINLAQSRVIEDYIRKFRSQLLSTLAWQNITPPEPEIPATRAIGVNLNFIDITLAEMRPSAMRGSGAITDSVPSKFSGVAHELGSLTVSIMNYMRRELDQSLRDRIRSLSHDDSASLIADLEEIVTRVTPIITLAQKVSGDSIDETRRLGVELGRSDLPDRTEIESVIRDVPQFESAASGTALPSEAWKLLGAMAARSRFRISLQQNHEKQLTSQLGAYGYALEQWAHSMGRTLQRTVNSYLDVFRGILQNADSSSEMSE